MSDGGREGCKQREVGGLCDVWVMVFSSMVEWGGAGRGGGFRGEKNGIWAWCELDSNIDKVIHPVGEIQKMGEWGIQTACREGKAGWGPGG